MDGWKRVSPIPVVIVSQVHCRNIPLSWQSCHWYISTWPSAWNCFHMLPMLLEISAEENMRRGVGKNGGVQTGKGGEREGAWPCGSARALHGPAYTLSPGLQMPRKQTASEDTTCWGSHHQVCCVQGLDRALEKWPSGQLNFPLADIGWKLYF